MRKNHLEEKKKTLIFLFISKISVKNMQDFIYFFKKEHFHLKRVTKNYKKTVLPAKTFNSNFVLESHGEISEKKLQNLIFFGSQYAIINNIFFQNQILNQDRVMNLEESSGHHL